MQQTTKKKLETNLAAAWPWCCLQPRQAARACPLQAAELRLAVLRLACGIFFEKDQKDHRV